MSTAPYTSDNPISNLPISTGAGQHLVDTDDVEGVDTDTQMERVLSGGLGYVLVGANTCGFQSLTRELLVLIGNKVAAEGELVYGRTLAAEIENADLLQTTQMVNYSMPNVTNSEI